MELYTDSQRLYISDHQRVKGFSKKELLEKGKLVKVWQSKRLRKTPVKLCNTERYLIGAVESILVKMNTENGETSELWIENEIKDFTTDIKEIFFVTAEGVYKVSEEKFNPSGLKKLIDLSGVDKPLRSLCLRGDFIYLIGGNFLYKIHRKGRLDLEKTLAEGIKLLPSEEGIVAITKQEILHFTEDLETLSGTTYEGTYIKAECSHNTVFLLTDKELGVFSLSGDRYSHVEKAHYRSFTEGLNHLYLYDEKEENIIVVSKRELLGDNYTEVNLSTLSAIIMTSLLAVEREGAEVLIKEERGFVSININGERVSLEEIVFKLYKYFPELFYLYKNPGYYREVEKLALSFKSNPEPLEELLNKHRTFKTFEEDIAKDIIELSLKEL